MTASTLTTDHIARRNAGFLYLAIIILGIGSEGFLRGGLIDWTDGAATAQAISGNLMQFRLSLIMDLLMLGCDVALAVLFWRLLRDAGETRATMAAALRLMQAAIIAMGLMTLFAAEQAVAAGEDPLPHLLHHAVGYDLGLFFFGLGGLATAGLLCRAGAPRAVAAGICAAALVYIAGSLSRFLAPEWNAAMQPAYVVPVVAETVLALWLAVGRPTRTQATA